MKPLVHIPSKYTMYGDVIERYMGAFRGGYVWEFDQYYLGAKTMKRCRITTNLDGEVRSYQWSYHRAHKIFNRWNQQPPWKKAVYLSKPAKMFTINFDAN